MSRFTESVTLTDCRAFRGAFRGVVCLALLVLPAGCDDPGATIAELRQRNSSLEKQLGQFQRDHVALQEELKNRKAQITRLQRLGTRRLDLLNPAARIEIDRLSGGYDEDGLPGDEGVVVYLKPIDAEGDVIKATGEIEIQLWDLAASSEEVLIGQYVLDAVHARKLWYGKFLTYHYTIRCPWREEPPRHDEVTVRVLFTDYVSGDVLRDQRVCRINIATLPDRLSPE
ncbi:MAG: hypothetical protein JSU68_00395 [Phycisphaerales bacterium]|nr:MAG: hypothetical protein JSU68_00395 [Phycisphaerales bacterium]